MQITMCGTDNLWIRNTKDSIQQPPRCWVVTVGMILLEDGTSEDGSSLLLLLFRGRNLLVFYNWDPLDISEFFLSYNCEFFSL